MWIIFGFIIFNFVPIQSDYYFDNDIRNFKKSYFWSILFCIGGLFALTLFTFLFLKTKSPINSVVSFLKGFVMIGFYLFIFQSIFLAAILFVNRQYEGAMLTRTLVVNNITEKDSMSSSIIAYDISNKNFYHVDSRNFKLLYHSGLVANDTISIKLSKGFFDIAYPVRKKDFFKMRWALINLSPKSTH